MAKERLFSIDMSQVKYGPGALDEAGPDARALGMTRAAVFTDPNIKDLPFVAQTINSLKKAGVDVAIYDQVRAEPTDQSFMAAVTFAREAKVDGFVSVGGGSTMDTAKAANLLTRYPAELLDYVAQPHGAGKPVPGPLFPHIACPTTSGTGSELTGVAVFDYLAKKVKTGISHRLMRPSMALIDPTTALSLPPGVVASTGFDVLTHAIESLTARPYTERDAPATPAARPLSQGCNPWSDIGALHAIRLGGQFLERAVNDPNDHEARGQVMYAAALAGLAFGNAGVHIPHAMSYSVAGLNHSFVMPGYEKIDPVIPHGVAVVLNAPAAFRWSAQYAPERHLMAAEALGADVRNAHPRDAGEILSKRLADLMRATGIPNGLSGVGYTEKDVPALASGAVLLQRLLVNAPHAVSEADLNNMYADALRYW